MISNKIILPTQSLKAGMRTAEVVFNSNGNVMLWEDVILDEITIERLKNVGVLEVAIQLEQPREIRTSYGDLPKRFKLEYEKDKNDTKEIFQTISTGKNIDFRETDNLVQSVFKKNESNRNIIDSITRIQSIDEYTYYHSLNVSMLCMIIGKWLRLEEYDIKNLIQAGLLHDIGKAKIPLEIMNKPGKLTADEFNEIRRHSEYGYVIINKAEEISSEVAKAVLTHHEKEDGSGYPMGLPGDKLNLYSKIITVADIFDAMTSDRAYKKKQTPFKVFELMQHGSFGILDPIVLRVFLENVTSYYVGGRVLLNTGETGTVVFINMKELSRPIVQVGDRYIDISATKFIKIKEYI